MNDPESMDPYGPQNHPLPPMKESPTKDKTTKGVVTDPESLDTFKLELLTNLTKT